MNKNKTLVVLSLLTMVVLAFTGCSFNSSAITSTGGVDVGIRIKDGEQINLGHTFEEYVKDYPKTKTGTGQTIISDTTQVGLLDLVYDKAKTPFNLTLKSKSYKDKGIKDIVCTGIEIGPEELNKYVSIKIGNSQIDGNTNINAAKDIFIGNGGEVTSGRVDELTKVTTITYLYNDITYNIKYSADGKMLTVNISI